MGQPLIFALGSVNAQVNLFELPMPYDPTVGIYRSLEAVRNLLAQTNELGFEYSYLLDGDIYTTGGMSILPPPLHDGYYPTTQEAWKFRREQFTPEDYEADRDGPLAIYLNICELLVRLLGISETGEDLQGGKTDTYRDIDEQAAVAALLNPKIARLAWPCRDDLETFEEYVLLPYIGRVMVDRAQDSAIEELKRELGLTHLEAFDLIETYKTYAQQANTFDPERERSLAIGKLQKLIEDCANSGMVTTQHNTLKTYLMTLGLTRHDDDSNIDRRAGLENILEAEILRKSEENDSEDATGKLRQIETEEGT